MMSDGFDPARWIAVLYIAALTAGAVLALVRGRRAERPMLWAEALVCRISPAAPNPPAPSASHETI